MLARLSEIDVSTEGVKGAKSFFEAKVRNGGLWGALTPLEDGGGWDPPGPSVSRRISMSPSCTC